jgi:hypothetical protein
MPAHVAVHALENIREQDGTAAACFFATIFKLGDLPRHAPHPLGTLPGAMGSYSRRRQGFHVVCQREAAAHHVSREQA